MKKFLLCTTLLPLFTLAQDTCKLKIGVNLFSPQDYGAEQPFVDIIKTGRSWITHNKDINSGAFDTGAEAQMALPKDTNGYPTVLPFKVANLVDSQIVHMVWDNIINFPSGTYVLLYDGEGDFLFKNALTQNATPGRTRT